MENKDMVEEIETEIENQEELEVQTDVKAGAIAKVCAAIVCTGCG